MDYRAEDVVEQIKRAVPDLIYTFDTIGSKDSSRMASHAVGGAGGTLCTVRPGKANTEEVADGVTVTDVLVWTAFLKEHSYGKFYWPVSGISILGGVQGYAYQVLALRARSCSCRRTV